MTTRETQEEKFARFERFISIEQSLGALGIKSTKMDGVERVSVSYADMERLITLAAKSANVCPRQADHGKSACAICGYSPTA